MPLSRMKLVQAFLVAWVALATPLIASAQESGRFWTPLTDLEKPQEARGLYASLEATYWSIASPKKSYIGYMNPDGSGGTREVYTGKKETQRNSLDTSYLQDTFSLGTRIEIGYQQDHHGWFISGYGLPGQSTSHSSEGAVNMVINDQVQNTTVMGNSVGHPSAGDVTQATLWWDPNGEYLEAQGSGPGARVYRDLGRDGVGAARPNVIYPGSFLTDGLFSGFVGLPYQNYPFVQSYAPVQFTIDRPVGFLWGWVPVKTETISDFHINGAGNPVQVNHQYTALGIAPLPITFDSVTVKNRADNWSFEAMYTYRLHPNRWGGLDFLAGVRYWHLDENFSVTATGERQFQGMPISILDSMSIDSSAANRIVGPQIGLRYSRKVSRYTGVVEGRFFPGVNMLTMRNDGYLASASTNPEPLLEGALGQTYLGVPIGLSGGATTFSYRQTKQVFSPGFELRANAHWQFTRQVGLQIGFSGLWVDSIVRGSDVNDYSISPTGQVFGVRDDNASRTGVFVYGLNVGLVCNRF